MSERLRMVHEGWLCTTRDCDTVFPWDGPGNYLSTRAASQSAAQQTGWFFNLTRRGLLTYCPTCAPPARQRVQVKHAATVLANYRTAKGRT